MHLILVVVKAGRRFSASLNELIEIASRLKGHTDLFLIHSAMQFWLKI
jgi:hypothetical protein